MKPVLLLPKTNIGVTHKNYKATEAKPNRTLIKHCSCEVHYQKKVVNIPTD